MFILFAEKRPDLAKSNEEKIMTFACGANKKNRKVINFMINKGTDINALNSKGQNCLYAAAISADSDFYNYLIIKGANPDTMIQPDKVFNINKKITVNEFVLLRLNSYQDMRKSYNQKRQQKPKA